MILNNTLTDKDFLNDIVNCTLSPELFTHEAQLRLSWILINKYGLEVATLKNCKIKENYFINALKSDKFNRNGLSVSDSGYFYANADAIRDIDHTMNTLICRVRFIGLILYKAGSMEIELNQLDVNN